MLKSRAEERAANIYLNWLRTELVRPVGHSKLFRLWMIPRPPSITNT